MTSDLVRNWVGDDGGRDRFGGWYSRPDGCFTVGTAPDGTEAACLERPEPGAEPVYWFHPVQGMPVRRRMELSLRAWVEAGALELWVRPLREDGEPIQTPEVWRREHLSAEPGWQLLSVSFAVPGETAALEVGAALPHAGRAWVSEASLKLLADDPVLYRRRLVETMEKEGAIPSPAVRQAFIQVPRHLFLPSSSAAEAYEDAAITTHFQAGEAGPEAISSSSQPSMMGIMLGLLKVERGMRVLEIGAGTGYNAAILAELAGARNVVSVDLDQEIVDEARSALHRCGYDQVAVLAADGWQGYAPRAPYERIIVTVGVHDLAPAWTDQLQNGGLLVAPLSLGYAQVMPVFRKRGKVLVSQGMSYGFFVSLRGAQPRRMEHCYGEGRFLYHDNLPEGAAELADQLLGLPPRALTVPELGPLAAEDWWRLNHFYALAYPLTVGIFDARLRESGAPRVAWGLLDLSRRGLAVATRDGILVYGEETVGAEATALARRWLALGRPAPGNLEFTAFPRHLFPRADRLPPGKWEGILEKPHTWIGWQYIT